MAYKMKGPSLYRDKLTVYRNGYDNKPDGRSKSSMAQKEVHSMFYQNKPGAPDMKTGKYAHSFEKEGAPKLKGNQHKIDKNKDGKISKADFDMMNKKGAPKYKSDAQRKAVHASKADGGAGNPNKMVEASPIKDKLP